MLEGIGEARVEEFLAPGQPDFFAFLEMQGVFVGRRRAGDHVHVHAFAGGVFAGQDAGDEGPDVAALGEVAGAEA